MLEVHPSFINASVFDCTHVCLWSLLCSVSAADAPLSVRADEYLRVSLKCLHVEK